MGRKTYSDKRLNKLKESKFIRLMGINKVTFNTLVNIIDETVKQNHNHKKGRKPKCTAREMVIIFLIYINNYNAMEDIAFEWKLSKSTVCEYIHFVCSSLLKNINFTLFGKKYIRLDDSENRLLDVTEVHIERPKKGQRKKYSGKKKYHTMKIQIIAGSKTKLIYEIQTGTGSEHDFKLFKRTFKSSPNKTAFIADLGYLGINKLHKNSEIPKKKSKNNPLTKEDKKYNKKISSERIHIEHINSWLKRFKILGTRFRNKLSYFAKFTTIICGLYNFHIA